MSAQENAATPDYRPFTDSILADISALPAQVRGELVGELQARHGLAFRENWSAVAAAVLMPLAALLAYHVFGGYLSSFGRGVVLGVVAVFAVEGLGAVAGAVEQLAAARRLHRANARRRLP